MASEFIKQGSRNQNKQYRNHSNIQLADYVKNDQGKNHQTYNYRTYSQIGNLLSDNVQYSKIQQNNQNTARNNKFYKKNEHLYIYKNRFAQQEQQKQYKVPQNNDPQFQRTNANFVQFLTNKKKFTKPYAQCTKYVDNLMKNKQLLRRGQFDLPVQANLAISRSITNTTTNKRHSNLTSATNTNLLQCRNYRKQQYKSIQVMKQKSNNNKLKYSTNNCFTKTLQNHQDSYRQLMKVQRNSKKSQIVMKNSMNRILAAQMVNYKLSSINNMTNTILGRTKSMKLDKTH